MADDFAVNAGEKAAFSDEVAGNGLAPLWEIYQDLIVNEPTQTEPTVIWKWRELESISRRLKRSMLECAFPLQVVVLCNLKETTPRIPWGP